MNAVGYIKALKELPPHGMKKLLHDLKDVSVQQIVEALQLPTDIKNRTQMEDDIIGAIMGLR